MSYRGAYSRSAFAVMARKNDAGRNGRKRNGADKVRFPTKVVAEILRPYVDEAGIRTLAQRANIPERRVAAILYGETQYVTLTVVDDLITKGLSRPDLLLGVEELCEVYEAAA